MIPVFIRTLVAGIGWKGWLGLALATALVAGVIMLRSADRAAGAAGALQGVQRANDAARDKADAAAQRVLDCPAGRWVRGEGCKP